MGRATSLSSISCTPTRIPAERATAISAATAPTGRLHAVTRTGLPIRVFSTNTPTLTAADQDSTHFSQFQAGICHSRTMYPCGGFDSGLCLLHCRRFTGGEYSYYSHRLAGASAHKGSHPHCHNRPYSNSNDLSRPTVYQ